MAEEAGDAVVRTRMRSRRDQGVVYVRIDDVLAWFNSETEQLNRAGRPVAAAQTASLAATLLKVKRETP